jgi:uncharacterized protein (TIGR03086 family)
MDLNAQIEDAATEVATVVRGTKPDQLGMPTPCPDWDVRALVNHLFQVVNATRLAASGEPVPDELWAEDLVPADWAERFEDETRRAVTASAEHGAWDGMRTAGSTEMPAQLLAAMLISDLVIHGWDLARATGQPFRCDDAAVDTTYRFLVDSGEQGREMGIFAAAVPVVEDAPTLDRALGLSGRDPQWTS